MPPVPRYRPPFADVVCAVVLVLLILLSSAWLLLRLPDHSTSTALQAPLRLRWLAPVARPALQDHGEHSSPTPALQQPRTAAGQVPAQAGRWPVRRQAPLAQTAAGATPPQLFDPRGRVQLPDPEQQTAIDARSTAQRVFEQRDERFLQHRDRGLFERERGTSGGQSRAQRAIYGRDVQAAQARQAPAIAYNPALHEQPSDLPAAGSAQAYLAAPIADQPVPGLDGQASAHLLKQQAQRSAAVQACAEPALQLVWAALEQHLQQLRRHEARISQGSTPEERRHTLPHEIARHYNLARRALWQLDQLLPGCRAG